MNNLSQLANPSPQADSPSALPGLEHLRLLLENSQDLLVEITREGRILYVSPNVRRVLGFEPGELIGATVFERIHPDDLSQALAQLGLPECWSTCRYMHKDGSWRWFETSGRDFSLPGGTQHSVLIVRDITPHKHAEIRQYENQHLLATLLSNLPGMAYRCRNDADWTMEFVSAGCRELTGYAPEDLVANRAISYGRLIESEDQQAVWDQVQAALEAGNPFELNYRIRAASGAIKWVRENGQGIYSNQGELLALEGFVMDVTERKSAEQALAASERTVRAILDQSFQFIGLLDTQGRLLRPNQTSLDAIGAKLEDVQGRLFWETPWWTHSPEEQNRLREAIKRAADGEFVRYETTHPSTDGRILHVDFSLKPVRDERGCVIALIPEGRDITEQKQAERALRDSENKFARAFRSSPGAMSIVDLETLRFIDVNHGHSKLFGFAREETIGHTPLELGLWDSGQEHQQFLEAFAAEGSVRDMEVAARTKSGRRIICLVSAASIELSGRKCRITALHDITAQRNAEKEKASLEAQLRQAQKLEAVGTLAGGIAHDFNNILAAIMAYTELAVLDADQPQNVRSHLAQVRVASVRAKDLVQQILTFSRQQKQERKPLRMNLVAKEALKLLRSTIPATIEIESNIDANAPVVLADPSQIHQVLMNLCTNAAHAMREGAGKLTVSLSAYGVNDVMAHMYPSLRPGPYARLTVTDTGHGMDTATSKRIYEPFFTTKGPGEGTGLGLSVVHGIVKEHDGGITMQSELGKGTTFHIYLPAFQSAVQETGPSQPPAPRGRGEHILLVDDEPALCMAIRLALERMGYQVTTQTNPEEALTRFRNNPEEFDLVITDLAMPHMNGVDLAKQILRLRPGQSVLLASGFSGIWTAEKVRSTGIQDLITKPMNMAELGHIVHLALTRNTLN